MRDGRLFEYRGENSRLAAVSPLVKLSALIVLCIAAALLPAGGPVLLLPVFIPLFIAAGRAACSQLAAAWKVYIFFLISSSVRYFTSGSVIEAASFAAVLFSMFFAGILFYSTTKISDFRRALRTMLKPIPLINGKKLSDLIAMTIAFLPMIFKASAELSEAEYSRGFRAGRSPIRAVKIKSLPLIINLFLKSEEMADAYYARGYGLTDTED